MININTSCSEYLAEHISHNINISYSEHLAERISHGISYSEYIAERISHNISYSEYEIHNLRKRKIKKIMNYINGRKLDN